MPRFKYKAKKISGQEIEGEREAKDKFELARELRQNGYILVSSEDTEKVKKQNTFLTIVLSLLSRVSTAEKMLFARNLGVMIAAGLPISRALSALGRQTKNKKFKSVIADLGAGIQKGEPLSRTMEKHPEVFSALFISMVKAGERSGGMPESLNLISQQLERDLTLTRRVRGAMMYPAIIVVAMLLIGAAMMIYVVPTLLGVFEELGVDLPLSTKIVIFVSNSFLNHGFLVLLILLIAIISFIVALRTKTGRGVLDFVFLRLPLISPLVKKINSSRTTRTLSSLISAGVEIVEAFEVAENVLQNHYYKGVLTKAKVKIQKGSPIAEVFIAAENLYPPLVGEMVAVGEETGKLPDMLMRLAVFYEEEVGESTKNLTTIIEPIMMIFIGAIVGFFAVSMMQPMYSMMGGI